MSERTEPKLMVVHHSKEHAEDIALFFEGQGYQTETFTTIRDAERKIYSLHYDAMLLSLLMPDGNGLEFCKSLKKESQTQATKVILLSSIPKGGKFALEAKSKYLADVYIEEPIQMQDLIEQVNKLLKYTPGQGDENFEFEGFTKEELEEQEEPEEPEAPVASVDDDDDLEKFAATELDSPDGETGALPRADKEETDFEPFGLKSSGEISMEGTLGPVLFPELLLALYQSRATGTLFIRIYGEERSIYFSDGIPQFIQTNFIHEESLGQLLIRQNKVTPAQLKKVLKQVKETKRQIGELLIESNFLTNHELETVLKKQARFKLISAFKLIDGTYEFTPGPALKEISIRIDSDILRILHAGVSRHMSLTALEKKIFGNRSMRVLRRRIERIGPADIGLTREQWALIGLADGERILGDIIADSRMNFKDTFQTIYLMFLFGVFYFEGDHSVFFQLDEAVLARAVAESKTMGGEAIGDIESGSAFPTTGDLEDIPVAHLFYSIHDTGDSGILNLDLDDYSEKISFRKGAPVRLETIGPGDHVLGEVMMNKGVLTTEQRDEALMEVETSGRPLGEVLIGSGAVSPHQVFDALREQVSLKLKFLFNQKIGVYHFERMDPDEIPSDLTFDVDVAQLALTSMKESMSEKRLEADMMKFKAFVLEKSGHGRRKLDKLFKDPKEVLLIGFINGRRSLAQVVERSPMTLNDTLKTIFVLVHLKLVRFIQD